MNYALYQTLKNLNKKNEHCFYRPPNPYTLDV